MSDHDLMAIWQRARDAFLRSLVATTRDEARRWHAEHLRLSDEYLQGYLARGKR